jgi:hypothetical protein
VSEDAEFDPMSLPSTEDNERCRKLDRAMRRRQFDLPALEQLLDGDLVYLAGHRDWVESEHGHVEEGDHVERVLLAQGIQQKVRGNAHRAKAELDRRTAARQLDALERSNAAVAASNEHVASTATSTRDLAATTRTMAKATIAAAIAAAIAALISIAALTRDEPPPTVVVDVATTTSAAP